MRNGVWCTSTPYYVYLLVMHGRLSSNTQQLANTEHTLHCIIYCIIAIIIKPMLYFRSFSLLAPYGLLNERISLLYKTPQNIQSDTHTHTADHAGTIAEIGVFQCVFLRPNYVFPWLWFRGLFLSICRMFIFIYLPTTRPTYLSVYLCDHYACIGGVIQSGIRLLSKSL